MVDLIASIGVAVIGVLSLVVLRLAVDPASFAHFGTACRIGGLAWLALMAVLVPQIDSLEAKVATGLYSAFIAVLPVEYCIAQRTLWAERQDGTRDRKLMVVLAGEQLRKLPADAAEQWINDRIPARDRAALIAVVRLR